jgi:UDP-glucose 4-epimerase
LHDENPNLKIVFSDITDSSRMNELIKDSEQVVHLGALIAIPYSFTAPRSYVNTNIMGTLNVLEAVRLYEKRLINVSTSEVYGTPKLLPITEQSEIQPQSPYAATKVAADALCNSYVDTYGLDISIIRPFNTFGPRQSQRALIPTILSQIASGNKTISLGNLDARRDFTYVTDTARAIKLAAESENIRGKTVHLGSGKTISVQELIGVVNEVLETDAKIKTDEMRLRPKMSEVEILQSDPSFARETLGWESKVSLQEGIQKTYEWIQKNKSFIINSSRYVT